MVMSALCRKNKIPLRYMEFGCVPGTFVIEKSGQQGESFPARHPHLFRCCPVASGDIKKAVQIAEYIYRTELNRNVQPPRRGLEAMASHWKTNTPVITYMGQNDYESGLYPYTKKTKKYHSPSFKSTLEGLEFLSLLSIKNDWRLIYKPHPIMLNTDNRKELSTERWDNGSYCSNGIICLENVNIHEVIDFSDVIITILSQSAYVSLFRNKPVVMMGYTQLKGSGCTYEAFSKEQIEPQIRKALKEGFSKKQMKNFHRHIARAVKYYLLDDGTHPDIPFGIK